MKRAALGGIRIPDFKLPQNHSNEKTTRSWHKNRHEDQQNRIEDPDMNPCSYAHLFLTKYLSFAGTYFP
jgi:hypothetical protein